MREKREKGRWGACECVCVCVCVLDCKCVCVCLHAFEEFLVAGRRRSLNLSSGSTGET